MAYGLGIDTGGTFTDAAVVDFDTKRVVFRTKAPTTHQDLSVGIAAALAAVPQEWAGRVSMVSLSTTLATNACVEGKGAATALILMGYDESLFTRLAHEYGLQEDVSVRFLPGRHSQRGEEEEAPDWDALAAALREVAPHVAAIGISEYWGVRNPAFEREARRIARQVTGLPVAAAHELTDEINSMRRAVTTSLNARLIPLIDDLLRAVRACLDGRGIHAPVMVVRGDGSLMTEAFARERPVETLLSGPAASLVGGVALCGLDDAVIVDIGGTTTDIALIRRGRTALSEDGVDVGAFRTGTKAIRIRTIGLGGDSLLSHNKADELTLGPRRAVPLSCVFTQRGDMCEALSALIEEDLHRTYHRGEGFRLGARPAANGLTAEERAILDALCGGPLFIDELAAAVRQRAWFLPVARLEVMGAIERFGLTLTDIWHVRGEMSLYDPAAARLAVRLLALRMGCPEDELVARALQLAGEKLFRVIADFLLSRAPVRGLPDRISDGDRLLHLGFLGGGEEIDCRFVVPLPLVGIGAPTHLLLPAAAKAMYTSSLVPPDAGVANAVGAISGSVLSEERVYVKPHHEPWGIDGYSVHSAEGCDKFDDLQDALAFAKQEAARLAVLHARDMGAGEVEPSVSVEEQSARPAGDASPILLGVTVVGRGMGKLSFRQAKEAG